MTQEFSGGLADVVACAVVQIHLERRGINTRLSARSEPDLKEQIAKLAEIVSADLQPTQSSMSMLTGLAQRSCDAMLDRVETTQTPFGDAFRQYAEEELVWDELVDAVIDEFAHTVAALYLEVIYRAALHGELGWEPDAGTSPDAIVRARRAVELLQRITRTERHGRKPDDPDEVRRQVQRAVDCVIERGQKLTRVLVAAEIPISPSGLDDMQRRHRLRITKNGRVEFSAIN